MEWVKQWFTGGSNESQKIDAMESREFWPYIWAIRSPEVLDWKRGLSESQIHDCAKKQSELPVEILPHLFLSDASHARNISALKERGITHCLNVAGGYEKRELLDEYASNGIAYHSIAADDEDGYPMLEYHLEDCRNYVNDAKKTGGKCVVHCVAGINRSGVIAAALLLLERLPSLSSSAVELETEPTLEPHVSSAEKALEKPMNVLEVVSHCRRRRGNAFLWNHSFQTELVALAKRNGLLGPLPGEVGCLVQEVCSEDFPEDDHGPPPRRRCESASTTTGIGTLQQRGEFRPFKAADVRNLF